MVSRLLKKKPEDEVYYCSNCMMRQPRILPNCFWCGNSFSNIEEVLRKDFNEKFEETLRNEDNIRRRN